MTNQTTDEAAVDIVDDLRVIARASAASVHVCQRVEDAADEIETLRAQLTAATAESRRFKALADDHFRNAQQIAERHTAATRRAEQAERMLAERDEALTQAATDLEWIVAMTTGRPSPPKRCSLINWKAQMAVTSIRSAASGEQG